ncbi:hypothetical protein JHK86_028234 [Glycine max]|nr:hypothetical protein JHK86_028234 [Glycine max]
MGSLIYGKGSLELVWENGQLHVQQGGSSSTSSVVTRMTPSCEGSFNAKSARLSSLYSLMDFPVQRDSALDNSQPNSHQSNDQNSGKFAKAANSSSKGLDRSLVINSPKGSPGRQKNPLNSDTSNMVPRSEETTPPDEQSEAVGHDSIHGSRGQYFNQTSSSARHRAKGKAHDTKQKYCDEALLESSSLCSIGASNNRNVCSRTHDDIDDSTYLSNNDEEPEDVVKEKPAWEGTGVKRSRNAEVHNLCERKRRDKINKRMRILKELIPNCNKTDKASMLDDAIEYLKTLKLQLQMMSMGAGFCMPFMMLPNAAHHMMNTPHLHQLMGLGMGFRPGTAMPCSLPQFPITPLHGITDNRVHMFGFPNQVPPMPISHAPFIPMLGNPSTQPTPLATSTNINLAENPASSQLTTLMASSPKNLFISGQAEYATKQ